MGSSLFVVDSNVFIAFYNQADAQHEDAVSILQEIENETIIVYPYVIQEVATVLVYRFGITVARKFLNDITNAHNVLLPPVEVIGDIEYFSSVNKKISFTDSSLVRIAKRMNAGLITFDKQMIALLKK